MIHRAVNNRQSTNERKLIIIQSYMYVMYEVCTVDIQHTIAWLRSHCNGMHNESSRGPKV